MKLGFIGLGIMGTPMALRLAKAGHALHVTTIGPVAEELLKQGAQHFAVVAVVIHHQQLYGGICSHCAFLKIHPCSRGHRRA